MDYDIRNLSDEELDNLIAVNAAKPVNAMTADEREDMVEDAVSGGSTPERVRMPDVPYTPQNAGANGLGVVAPQYRNITADRFKDMPTMSAAELTSIRRQGETGMASEYDGTFWGGVKSVLQSMAHNSTGKLTETSTSKAQQTILRGYVENDDGTVTYLENLSDEDLNILMDEAGANGAMRYFGSFIPAISNLIERGEGDLMKQFDRRVDSHGRPIEYESDYARRCARAKYAQDIMRSVVSEKEGLKQAAEMELANRESSTGAELLAGLYEQGAYTGTYIAGSALAATLGLPTVAGAVLPGLVEGGTRFGERRLDEYGTDEDGNIGVTSVRDDFGTALRKGVIRGVTAPAIEMVGGRVIKPLTKPLGWVAKATLGKISLFKTVGNSAVATTAGRAVDAWMKRMRLFGKLTGMQSMPEEALEEFEDQVIDAALGLDRNDDALEGTTAAGRALESAGEFFKPENLGDLAKSMLLMQVLQSGIAYQADRSNARNWRKDEKAQKDHAFVSETKDDKLGTVKDKDGKTRTVFKARNLDAMLMMAGVDANELKYYTAPEKAAAVNAWIGQMSEEDVAKTFKGAEKAVAELTAKMSEAGRAFDFGQKGVNEVDAAFTIGEFVPTEDGHGNQVERMTDAQSGVSIDMVRGTDGGVSYRVRDGFGNIRAAADKDKAITYADSFARKNATRKAKVGYIEEQRRGGLLSGVDVIYGANIESVMDELERRGVDRRGIDGSEGFDPSNPGFHVTLPDGNHAVCIVLDNNADVRTMNETIAHEAGTHYGFAELRKSGELGDFFKKLSKSGLSPTDRIRFDNAVNAIAQEYGLEAKLDAVLANPRAAEELWAYTTETMADRSPSVKERFVASLREWWRKRFDGDLQLNGDEIYVMANAMMRDMRGAEGGTATLATSNAESQDEATRRREALDADLELARRTQGGIVIRRNMEGRPLMLTFDPMADVTPNDGAPKQLGWNEVVQNGPAVLQSMQGGERSHGGGVQGTSQGTPVNATTSASTETPATTQPEATKPVEARSGASDDVLVGVEGIRDGNIKRNPLNNTYFWVKKSGEIVGPFDSLESAEDAVTKSFKSFNDTSNDTSAEESATPLDRSGLSDVLNEFLEGEDNAEKIKRIVEESTDTEAQYILDTLDGEMAGDESADTSRAIDEVLEAISKRERENANREASRKRMEKINRDRAAKGRREENNPKLRFVEDEQLNPQSLFAFAMDNGNRLLSVMPPRKRSFVNGKFTFKFTGNDPAVEALNRFFDGVKFADYDKWMNRIFGKKQRKANGADGGGFGSNDGIVEAIVSFQRGNLTAADEVRNTTSSDDVMQSPYYNNFDQLLSDYKAEWDAFDEFVEGGMKTREEREMEEREGDADGFTLESATSEELKSEEKKRKEKAEIERRQNAPLKGGTGEVGQSLMDLGGAEGEDLFNRTSQTDSGDFAFDSNMIGGGDRSLFASDEEYEKAQREFAIRRERENAKRSAELFEKLKKDGFGGELAHSRPEVLLDEAMESSETIDDVLYNLRKIKAEATKTADEWAAKVYKKNSNTVDVADSRYSDDEYTQTSKERIDHINERHRQARVNDERQKAADAQRAIDEILKAAPWLSATAPTTEESSPVQDTAAADADANPLDDIQPPQRTAEEQAAYEADPVAAWKDVLDDMDPEVAKGIIGNYEANAKDDPEFAIQQLERSIAANGQRTMWRRRGVSDRAIASLGPKFAELDRLANDKDTPEVRWRRAKESGLFFNGTIEDYMRKERASAFADGEKRKAGAESIVYRTGDNETKSDIRWRIVGRKGAENAGIVGLDEAERMESSGTDRKEIWKKTGWWRGVDGKWRFEINDEQPTIAISEVKSRLFDSAFPMDYYSWRYSIGSPFEPLDEFVDNWRSRQEGEPYIAKRYANGEWTEREVSDEEAKDIQDKYESNLDLDRRLRERYNEYKESFSKDITLGELYPNLAKTYPQLSSVTLKPYRQRVNPFLGVEEFDGTYAAVSRDGKILYLDRRADENSIVHEIQHLIQHVESFAKGGSKEDFENEIDSSRSMKAEYVSFADKALREFRRSAGDKNGLSKWIDDYFHVRMYRDKENVIPYEDAYPNDDLVKWDKKISSYMADVADRQRGTALEGIPFVFTGQDREKSIELQRRKDEYYKNPKVEKISIRREPRGELDFNFWKSMMLTVRSKMREVGFDANKFNDSIHGFRNDLRSPYDKYRALAGEVEARNVEKRANMTAEERSATPPWETSDLDDTDQIIRWRRRYTPDAELRRMADLRELSDADRADLRDIIANGEAAYYENTKRKRDLLRRGTISPAEQMAVDATTQPGFGNKAKGWGRFLISKEPWMWLREKMQDSQISLREEERKRSVKANDSAYHAFDAAYGKIANDLKEFNEQTLDPFNRELAAKGFDEAKRKRLDMLTWALHAPEANRMIAERSDVLNKARKDENAKLIIEGVLNGTVALDDQTVESIADWAGLKPKEKAQLFWDLQGSGRSTAHANALLQHYRDTGFYDECTTPSVEGGRSLVDFAHEITKRTREALVASGRLSRKQADLWEQMSPNYMPFQSDFETESSATSIFFGLGRNKTEGNGAGNFDQYAHSEFHHAFGRRTIADSPIDAAIRQFHDAVARARDNEARRKMADMVRANPQMGYVFRFLSQSDRQQLAKEKAILENIVAAGTATPAQMAELNRVNATLAEANRADKAVPTTWVYGDNGIKHEVPVVSGLEGGKSNPTSIIAFKEDGDLKFIKLGGFTQEEVNKGALSDRDALRIATAVKYQNMVTNDGIRRLRTVTGLFSMARTSLVPTFILSNFLADTTQAALNLSATFGKNGAAKFMHYRWNSIKAARDFLANINRENPNDTLKYAKEWAANGGMIGGRTVETLRKINRAMTRDIRKLSRSGMKDIHSPKDLIRYLTDKGRDVMSFAEYWNSVIEMSTRIAAYATVRDMQKAKGETADNIAEHIAEAVSYARDVTVNFNRKGTLGNVINAWWAFGNANMQDIQRSLHALGEGDATGFTLGLGRAGFRVGKAGLKMWGALTALQFVASVLGHMLGDDPDDEKEGLPQFKDTPDYLKKSKLGILAGPNVRGINRSPMYFGASLFDVAFGHKGVLQAAKENLGLFASHFFDFAGDTGEAIADNINKVIPSVARPGFELYHNKDFMGRQIYREPFFGDKDNTTVRSELGKKETSGLSKSVARALNWMTGGSENKRGAIDVQPEKISTVVDWLFGGMTKDVREFSQTFADLATFNAPNMKNVPFLNRMVKQRYENSANYNKALERYDALVAEYEADVKDGNMDAAADMEREHPFLNERRSKRWNEELKQLKKIKTELQKAEVKAEMQEDYDKIHAMRMKTQYLFIHRLETPPQGDAEDAGLRQHNRIAERFVKKRRADERRAKKQEEREADRRKRGIFK